MNTKTQILDMAWRGKSADRDDPKTFWAYWIGFSTFLHLLAGFAILLLGSYADGAPGAPGPLGGLMTVGFYGGLPGDPLGGDGQPLGASPVLEPASVAEVSSEEPPPEPVAEPPEQESLAIPIATTDPEAMEAIALKPNLPEPEQEKRPQPVKRPKKDAPIKTAALKTPVPKASPPPKVAEGSGNASAGSGTGQGLGTDAAKPGGGDGDGGGGGGGEGGGGGGTRLGSLKGYIDSNYKYIIRHIRRKMVYPEDAKKQGVTGTATVAFTIGGGGQVSRVRIDRSSGSQHLDEAALSAVRRAAPFPPPPAPANIAIPLVFGLK